MWYIPKPDNDKLDDYVNYMSAKIKASPHYRTFKPVLEVERGGRKVDYVELLLRAAPSRQRKLSKALMKRIFGKKYQEKHLRQLKGLDKKRQNGTLTIPKEIWLYDTYHDKVNSLRRLFSYDGWIKGDSVYSYQLSGVKKTNSCPYCNRQYTLTIEQKDAKGNVKIHIAKPHFDHWYPQQTFPLLALSFYNLLPSCAVCNSSIKGAKVLSVGRFIHPYAQASGYGPDFKFRVLFKSDKDYSLCETRSSDEREERMKRAFYIEDVYKYHEKLEVEDLVTLQREYSGTYLKKMVRTVLKDLMPRLSVREIIRMLFGAEIDAAHMNDRPMSKLKKDLLEQFHIIDEKGNLHPEMLKMI